MKLFRDMLLNISLVSQVGGGGAVVQTQWAGESRAGKLGLSFAIR